MELLDQQLSITLPLLVKARVKAMQAAEATSEGQVIRDAMEMGLPAVVAAYGRGEITSRRPYTRDGGARTRFMMTPVDRVRLEEISATHQVSLSQIVRDAVLAGLPAREARSQRLLRDWAETEQAVLEAVLPPDPQFSG